MMRFALAALCATLLTTGAHAATITSSKSSFLANVSGVVTETTSFGLPYFDGAGNPTVINAVTLTDGAVLSGLTNNNPVLAGSSFAPLSSGYSGDLAYNSGTSETLSFDNWVQAIGFTFAPDLGIAAQLGLPNNASVTFALSNGQSMTDSLNSFDAGDSLFFGATNLKPGTTLTITVSGTDGFGNPIAGFAIGDILDVPEPASVALLGMAAAGMAFARRKRA